MGLGKPLSSSSDDEAPIDKELSQQSISELVTILRSAFRSSVFDKVEEILISRENKLLKKIACKDRKLSLALMDKLQAEDDLEICKKNCNEIRNTFRVREESCLLLQEELKKSGRLINELNLKNLSLEAAKTRAEAEVEALRAKLEDFNQRMVHLEKGFKQFEKHPHSRKHIKLEADEDMFSNLGASHPVKEGCRDSLGGESGQEVPNFDPGPTQDNLFNSKENSALAGTGHRIVGSAGVIVIVDSDDECAPQGKLSVHERTPQSVAESGRRPNSTPMGLVKDETGCLKRKWVAGDGLCKTALLTGELNSDSEISSSCSSDSDDDDCDKEAKKLRTHLKLETNVSI